MYTEAMFYVTVKRKSKRTFGLYCTLRSYTQGSLSRLDKYANNFNVNAIVTSAVNQVFQVLLPTAALSCLLKVRGGHMTCSDQWNRDHMSFLNRNFQAWMIGYAHLPFMTVTDSAPDGGSSICLPGCQSENEVACDYL